MEKNLSVIGVLIVCVILLGGLYALTQGPSAPTPLTPDQVQLLETKKDDYTKGPKDAKVVLTEYFDYECPPCGAYYPMVKQLEKDHPEVRFVFRYFPLSGHKNALNAAHAVEAAARQGKYFEMGDLVFSHQDEWGGKSEADASLFDGYAQKLGLSMKQWNADRESASVDERVQRDFNEGLKAGVEGTPTFFLNGEKINTPSSVEAFSDLLTEAGKAPAQQ